MLGKRLLCTALLLFGGVSPSNADANSKGEANSVVRLCVNVHVAAAMWPRGLAADADNDLSSFLAGEFFKLLRDDGINPYISAGKPKVAARNWGQLCNDPHIPFVNIQYDYLPNGHPLRMMLQIRAGKDTTTKTIERDISEYPITSIDNKNQIFVTDDLRQRAKEVFDLMKPYLGGGINDSRGYRK